MAIGTCDLPSPNAIAVTSSARHHQPSRDFPFAKHLSRADWPTLYLIDRAGQIRYIQIGEGHYGRTEAAIRVLLAEAVDPAAETRAAP